MRDFLGVYTVNHAQLPLSTYYLMYVPYSTIDELHPDRCSVRSFANKIRPFISPKEGITNKIILNGTLICLKKIQQLLFLNHLLTQILVGHCSILNL